MSEWAYMTGLILYGKKREELDNTDYVVLRFLEAAEQMNITMSICKAEQIEFAANDNKIRIDGQEVPLPDFFLPNIFFDGYYKNAVVRQLETLGSYTLNSLDAILQARDKLHTQQVLAQYGLPALKTKLVNFERLNAPFNPIIDISGIESELGYPVVVKNITGLRGYGINLCETRDQLRDLLELVYQNNKRASVLLQEFISASRGSALRVYVLGGEIVGHMKHATSTNFKSNFFNNPDCVIEQFELTKELQEVSLAIADVFQLNMTGIDYLFDTDGIRVCEVNAFPGFKGLEKATGKNIAHIVLSYIQKRIEFNKICSNIGEEALSCSAC